MNKKLSLTSRIFIGLVFGLIAGLIIHHGMPDGTLKNDVLINGLFQLVGQLFLRSIMMLIVPLVFVSIVHGVIGMGDVKKLGRVGARTLIFYMVTTAIAIIIALIIANILPPAKGVNLSSIHAMEVTVKEKVPLVKILTDIIPNNPISAFANGAMLQIISFGIILGIGISFVGDKASSIKSFFSEFNDVMLRLVVFIMKFAPYGVAALIGKTFATMGIQVLIPLLKYIGVVYIGIFFHICIVYIPILKFLGKVNPTIFFKKYAKVMSVAFSTASSGATLPINMEVMEEELGTSSDITSFTLPLGATINMDGTAIMQGVAIMFIAQVYGINLTLGQMITVALTTVLASIGTAGVPGAGAIMLSLVIQSVGLPIEGIGLILGVDRLVDMGRTTLNVTGDSICTIVMARKENSLDEAVYNNMNIGR